MKNSADATADNDAMNDMNQSNKTVNAKVQFTAPSIDTNQNYQLVFFIQTIGIKLIEDEINKQSDL